MIGFWFCTYNFDRLFFIHYSCDTLITGHSIVGFAMYYFTYDPWIGKLLYLEDFFVMSDYRGMVEFSRGTLQRNRGLKSLKWLFKMVLVLLGFGIGSEILKKLSQVCLGVWFPNLQGLLDYLKDWIEIGSRKAGALSLTEFIFLSHVTGCNEVSLQQHALLGGRVEWTIHQLLQKKRCLWSVQRRGMETLQDRQGVLAKNGSRGVRSAGVENDSFHSILE